MSKRLRDLTADLLKTFREQLEGGSGKEGSDSGDSGDSGFRGFCPDSGDMIRNSRNSVSCPRNSEFRIMSPEFHVPGILRNSVPEFPEFRNSELPELRNSPGPGAGMTSGRARTGGSLARREAARDEGQKKVGCHGLWEEYEQTVA